MTDDSSNPWIPDPARVAREEDALRRFGLRVLAVASAGLVLAALAMALG